MNLLKMYCFLLLSVASIGLLAQNDKQAEKLIADFIKSVESDAIQTDFIMTILDINDEPIQVQIGKFAMKGNKFSLSVDGANVFFDGKTQWTYLASNNEVSITEPTEDELGEVNPILILREYQAKCVVQMLPEGESPENYAIRIIPMSNAEFSKIVVGINKSTKVPTSILLQGKNSFSISIEFSEFKQNVNIANETFTFDKSKYKNVFENDLR